MKHKKVVIVLVLVLLMSVQAASAIRIGRGNRGERFETDDGFFGIVFQHDLRDQIPGLVINTTYTSTINLSDIRITDNKDLVMDMIVVSCTENLSLYVEHMHADVFLESTKNQWDGIIQDSMDDKYHSDLTYGFYIDENYTYSETFSIEGYSEFITRYHVYYNEYYVSGTESTHRLSESSLRKYYKCYGISFRVIYDVIFRYEGWNSTKTPKFIVEDNILLDLDEGFKSNIGDTADKSESSISLPFIACLAGLVVVAAIIHKKRKH